MPGLSQDNVVDLANIICGGLGSTASMNFHHQEILEDLANNLNPPLVDANTFVATSGQASWPMYSSAGRLLAVFFETRQLLPVSAAELESYDGAWRQTTGTAQGFYNGEDADDYVRFIPVPAEGGTCSWLTGVPDYSPNGSSLIPYYMGLYVAFEILKREFAYPSDHQDKEFSKLCGQVASVFGRLIGFL